MVILAVTVFLVRSTVDTIKGYTLDQLIFVIYMFLSITHISNCKVIPQRKQAHINYYNTHENESILDHD